MITELHIENIAVIKNLTVSFGKGFSVLTGETGAGKSIIIDSVNLLIGGRSTRELIRSGEERALVSACFEGFSEALCKELGELDVYPEEDGRIYIVRTISSDGKTSSKINGRSVPLSVLRDVGRLLINIHGQHDNQLLLTPSKHIDILDSYAHTEGALAEYTEKYGELAELRRRLKSNTRSEKEKAELADTLTYRISEIDNARLKPGEEETLAAKREKIRNIEKVVKYSSLIRHALTSGEGGMSASEQIRIASDAVERIADILPDAAGIAERLRFCMYELQDISDIAASLSDEEVADPEAELDWIESRLEIISRLESKYAPDIPGILAERERFAKELDELKNSERTIEGIRKELVRKAKEASTCAERLSSLRKEGAERLSSLVTEQLRFLDLEKVSFSVAVENPEGEGGTLRFMPSGCDEVEFLIAANPGEPLKALSKIASGGELSRVMLALKSVLADSDGVTTIIFDEIDTGVSGRTSQKIGLKLHDLSRECQIICITHSPQIAATADTQYKISKKEVMGRAETSVKPLDTDERVEEISRIMGGIEITDTVRRTAREMLEKGKNRFRYNESEAARRSEP